MQIFRYCLTSKTARAIQAAGYTIGFNAIEFADHDQSGAEGWMLAHLQERFPKANLTALDAPVIAL